MTGPAADRTQRWQRSRRTEAATAVLAALGVAALAAGLVLAGSQAEPASASGTVPGLGPQGRRAQFVVECDHSHAANDDPIVAPGAPGASHLHDFFGSTVVDAHTVAHDLPGTPTTCQQTADTASYWAPALLDGGVKVDPVDMVAYYRPAHGADPAELVAYPAGLVVVAGDGTATEPQPLSVAAWHCGQSPVLSPRPPSCTPSATLAMRVAFPSCWDGERLDSDDHASHMAYAAAGRCPPSHPVAVPELVVEVRYPIHGEGHDLVLASGDTITAHADFMNGWDQDALEREVRTCLAKGRICGVVSDRALA